ncbi:MAG: hypothetical protein RR598_06300 [Anaerorhabdus sp.]
MSEKFNQAAWDKKNMTFVSAKYKKEFVEEFKEACKKLSISQSDVFRKAMVETIMDSKISEYKNKHQNLKSEFIAFAESLQNVKEIVNELIIFNDNFQVTLDYYVELNITYEENKNSMKEFIKEMQLDTYLDFNRIEDRYPIFSFYLDPSNGHIVDFKTFAKTEIQKANRKYAKNAYSQ